MSNMLTLHKVERTKLRRLPLLPRVGLTVEIGGHQLVFKHAPALETLLNLRDRGFKLKALGRLVADELEEIRFPVIKRGLAAVKDLHAKTVEAKIVKKAAAKAATKKKADDAATV